MSASIRFADFASAVLALYVPPLRAPKTRDKMRQALREFGAVPGVRTTSDLTTSYVAAWIASRSGNVNTTISLK